MSTATRWLIWDGDRRGMGGRGGGGRMKARPRAPTRKIEEDVDRRQNNKNVKAMSPRYWVSS